MSCCGQKRAALASPRREGLRAASATPTSIPPPVPEAQVRLRYLRDRKIALLGAVSGRAYRFTPGATTEIDAVDAEAFIASGRFVCE
jgi:hypothetical protein